MSVVANVAINVDSRNAVSKLREVQSQAGATERAFKGVAAAAGKLALAFGAMEAFKFVFAKTAELESQTRSLEVLTGSAQKAGQIIKELQQLGAVTPFTSTELIDSAKRLQAFGVEADKVVETTKRLADVSGATGAELQGLVTAYGQVQAKGRLQGEELLQFQERGVALQEELRKMYGLSGEEFQKALEKGRIGSEAVEVAIKRLTEAGGKYANGAIAQSDTLNGRLSTLQDSIQVLAQTIGKTLAPVFQWALTQATAVVSEIQRLLDEANNTSGARGREIQFARNADAAVRAMGLNPFTQQGMMADMRQRNIEQQRADYRLRQQGTRTPSAPIPAGVPPLLGATVGGGGGGGGASKAANEAKRAAEAAKKEAERVAEVIRARLAEAGIIRAKSELQDKIAAAEIAQDSMLVARLQGQQRALDLQYQYAQQLVQETNKEAEKAIIFERQTALVANQREVQRTLNELQAKADQDRLNALQKVIEQQYKLNTGVQQQLQLADGIANTLGQGIGSAFDALIAGSESWGASLKQIASGVLIDIAKQLLQIFVIEQAINAIRNALTPFSAATPLGAGGGKIGKFGTLGPNYGIPQRANGGPVTGGSPYIVGERGPELFVPGRSGTIVPNDKMGGESPTNVVVNVDASGSKVEGNDQQGNQLGRVIAAAVQQEIIKQKRPGGLLV